ncbi:MAG: hypothetical protein KKH02_07740 [Proteobacteria bacterium]|nr:hypothetical protein [Pseudomonadota bacterium]
MKKFLVVLLSLGLIVAFGATASAADVKFGGSYYLVGVYDDNAMLAASNVGYSRAYFYQRVRLQPVFAIAEGLTFTARMDALEKQWGNTNWKSTTAASADRPSSRRNPGGTQKVQENFEFERAWVTFKTAVGQFDVGYQSGGAWGTVFADAAGVRARIKYMTKAGPALLLGIYEKTFDADTSAVVIAGKPYAGKADADNDNYYLAAVYGFKGGNAGLLYGYLVGNSNRVAAVPFRTRMHLLTPYLKATFGPVYVEAEMAYWGGNQVEFDNVAGATDLKRDGWSAYALLKTNMGPAYFGAQVGWSAGDDPSTTDKNEAGGGGGADWNPALILMNDDMATWAGGVGRNVANSGKGNILLYNVFGGFNPTKQLNLEVAFTSASADKAPTGYVSKNYGMELDAKASYKIYDNLTYMVGAGYLWTGDYFKGTNSANLIGNDYILMNKLSLSF